MDSKFTISLYQGFNAISNVNIYRFGVFYILNMCREFINFAIQSTVTNCW
jgi:hypothetical protein